jgi:hypothetical protein
MGSRLRGVAIFAKACFGHPSPSKRQKLNATTNALKKRHSETPSSHLRECYEASTEFTMVVAKWHVRRTSGAPKALAVALLLLTSLRSMLPEGTQKVLISAVISNAKTVGEWLNGDPKRSTGKTFCQHIAGSR